MAYCKALQKGHVYGGSTISGAGIPGQAVVMNANDEVIVNSDKTVVSFGILLNNTDSQAIDKAYVTGGYCAVAYDGGMYETDNFTLGGLQKGDYVSFDHTTGKFKEWATGDAICAQVLSVTSSVLKFKLLLAPNHFNE